MAIVTIFSGTFCHAEEVAEGTAKALDYKFIADDLFTETSKRFEMPEDKLRRGVYGPPPLLGNFNRERAKPIACLSATLGKLFMDDNVVYHGFAAHLLPRDITHILRVCVIANYDYRLALAMSGGKLSEKEARRRIKKDDEERAQWTQYLSDLAPYNENLYDIIIPMHATSVKEAIDIICENAKKEAVEATSKSRQALEDFVLTSKIKLALINEGHHDLTVKCEEGTATIEVNRAVVRMEHFMEQIRKIAASVPGVKGARAIVGPKFHQQPMIAKVEFELPKKVLLVDDEKEFVHTLSERLQTRNMESSVVYDGEQALSFVKSDEPEVMVLDLKMPGIDGLEVLRRVKKEHPDVEVIILTGHGSEKEEAAAMELGAFAYLQKPVNIDVLAQKMKEAYRKISEKKAAR